MTMRASSIFSNLLKISIAVLTCLMFTACPKKPIASPSDTLGAPSDPTRPRDGWIPSNPDGYIPTSEYDDTGDPVDFSTSGQIADTDPSLQSRGPGVITGEDGGIRGLVPSIYFDYDQSFVREDQRTALSETIAYLGENTSATVLVEGHCDFKGTTEYNLALGDRRAASIRDYLVDTGIDASRVSVVSKGDLEATQDGSDSERAEDRRADIIIYE